MAPPAPIGNAWAVLPHHTATRYVTPLREGGSLPAIVEADDDGTYVMKFRGAAQGVRVLVAEVIVAHLARALAIAVPELAVLELPRAIARYEPDVEVQDLLTASLGDNLGVDFLPGALGYDGSAPATRDLAERILWLDALTANVDRTWRNPNLLTWHGATWAIDHGAALYFHHSWPDATPDATRFAAQPYDATTHVLGALASDVRARHAEFSALLDTPTIAAAVAAVPDRWLPATGVLAEPGDHRTAYVAHLQARRDAGDTWLPGVAA